MRFNPILAVFISGIFAVTTGYSICAESAERAVRDLSSNSSVVVRYAAGRVDVTADNAPFIAVVAKLSATLNIQMEVKGSTDDNPVTLRLRDVPIESALRSLSRNVVTIYDNSGRKLKKAIFFVGVTDQNSVDTAETDSVPEPPLPTPVVAGPLRAVNPEGWVDPPASNVAPMQTWAGDP